ncbi:MAG: leucine--tRNA ligase, partial [Elusimicrobiota bacterium]
MKKYDPGKIERKWTEIWRREGVYEPDFENPRGKKFYNLMMFPYPSAEGLHIGNMYAFTGSDIYGRFKRMQGYDVFEPIGLDGFGIHSENYALKIGTHPTKQAEISEKRFYKQLEIIGNGFAWNERLETYKPEYYKWTQWIFTEMWRQGLVYRKKQAVNWCPSCKTVLSDEQAEKGKCERCENIVEKKDLEQWFFRITKYADKLLQNIETIDWSENVKIAQRNWIGKSEGALIKFQITNDKYQTNSKFTNQTSELFVEVFTTRPDTLFGATYMVVAPEHEIILKLKSQISNLKEVEEYIITTKNKSEEERIENKEKTGVELKGIKAINPVNNEEVPIFVADYILSGYGTGAIMAVPAHDERDFEFAKKFSLPIKCVIKPYIYSVEFSQSGNKSWKEKSPELDLILSGEKIYEGEGELINSKDFSGKNSEKAKWEITEFAKGKKQVQYRLRDWLISRQRYWGPPIPMIYCDACTKQGKGEQNDMPGWYAVPEKDLPVLLPIVKDFRPEGTGQSPLAGVEKFYKTKCPSCGGDARRETDVSDTFLDSAWYYIGYLTLKNQISNLKNQEFIPDKKLIEKWLPVDMYIGGAEHSVLHLLYVRFVAMALHDAGYLNFEEPFSKFRAHGLLIKDGAKMSKSKGNVINPDDYVKNFGADAFRMYLMFLAPFEYGGDFRDQGMLGITRFLDRVWKMGMQSKFIDKREEADNSEIAVHEAIKKVTEDVESLQYNTAISAMMILLNEFEKQEVVQQNHFKIFLLLLAPFAPFLTEELWQELFAGEDGNFHSIHHVSWPIYDPKKLEKDLFVIAIQVNGKVRGQIEVSKNITKEEAEHLALNNEKVKVYTEGKTIK